VSRTTFLRPQWVSSVAAQFGQTICHAKDGHTLAFAFLMNGIYPDYAHPIQDRMGVAVAKYSG